MISVLSCGGELFLTACTDSLMRGIALKRVGGLNTKPLKVRFMNELAGQSLGGYVLEEEIGRGSMGMVYRGKQIALGREVAIKVLPQSLARDGSYVARFIREAQIIAQLNHPNIVHIYDAGQQNKLLYFVMEYVQGPTLASLLHLDGIIPAYLAVQYGAQIADALDSAYKEHHVIHRDIKPENVMLDRWGKIRVMDFGLARATGHQPITVAKTLVGSIYYASPEQVWGYTLDNRSDIYALGVVLYEMVSGTRPYTGRSMPELTQAITHGPLVPPSKYNQEITPELEQIILKVMARKREERYEDASIVARELRALQLQAPSVALVSSNGLMVLPKTPRERTVIHPPKRPQSQRPRYLDVEPLEVQQAEKKVQPGQATHEEANRERALPLAFASHDATPPISVPLSDVDTHKAPISMQAELPEKSRLTFWGHIQRLFKSQSHEAEHPSR